ncbi:mediator of RNA polymerase II transcription subunit 1-like [Polymixia lowei]
MATTKGEQLAGVNLQLNHNQTGENTSNVTGDSHAYGMGFHYTDATCYLTSDLFYLEVVLLPGGGVEEVKVAPHGEAPVSSESFLQLLRSKNFEAFSMKLEGLATQYNIPGDKALKEYDPQVDKILHGRIGCLIAGKEDCPLTIQFYISSSDVLKISYSKVPETERVVHAAQVIVGFSDVTHKLQMASLIPSLPGEMIHSYVLPGAGWATPGLGGTVVHSIPFTHPAHVPALLELLRHQCAINTLLASCVTSRWASPGSVHDLHFEVLPQSDTSFSVTFHQPNTDSLAVLLVNVSDSRQLTCSLFAAGKGDPFMDEYISRVMRRSMSVPVTMQALCGKLAAIPAWLPRPACPDATEAGEDRQPTASPVPAARDAGRSIPAEPGAAAADDDAVLAPPPTEFPQSSTGQENNPTPSDSAYYLMSVATSEPVPEINTSPPVNPYPCASVDVYSHWITNSHIPELI